MSSRLPASLCRCRFHVDCVLHDDEGRRWDSYTAKEVAVIDDLEVEAAKPEWHCYCERHEATAHELPLGAPCVWRRTSYEYDEWECECLESYRDTWLSHQSIDWARIGHAEDRRWRRQQRLRRWKRAVVDFLGRMFWR